MDGIHLNPLNADNVSSSKCKSNLVAGSDDSFLKSILNTNISVYHFFCIMGVIWPDSTWSVSSLIIQKLWCYLLRICLMWSFVYGLVLIALGVLGSNAFFVLIGVSLSVQTLVLFPTIFTTNKRFTMPCLLIESSQFGKALVYAWIVFAFSLLLGAGVERATFCTLTEACYGGYLIFSSISNGFGQLSISCSLASNTFFLMVDVLMSERLVDDLIVAHTQHKMTIDMFNEYRSHIKRRIDSSFWMYNSVMFIAVLNILFAIIILYLHDGSVAIWPTVFLRETPFVLISLYFATNVNEKSDALTRALGTTVWTKEDIEQDNARLFYFSNAEAQRISFRLAGMRLKKIDLLFRISGSVLAFVFGLLKNALLKA